MSNIGELPTDGLSLTQSISLPDSVEVIDLTTPPPEMSSMTVKPSDTEGTQEDVPPCPSTNTVDSVDTIGTTTAAPKMPKAIDPSDTEGNVEDIPYKSVNQPLPAVSGQAQFLPFSFDRFGKEVYGARRRERLAVMKRVFPTTFIDHNIQHKSSWTPPTFGKASTMGKNKAFAQIVDDDAGLPPALTAPPNTPDCKPFEKRITNKEYARRAGPLPPLPEVDPEDRLHRRKEITDNLGGPERRKMLEEMQLTFTVRIAVKIDGFEEPGSQRYFITGLTDVENLAKLKTTVCQSQGHKLPDFMQKGSIACIYETGVSFVPKHPNANGVRQYLGESGRPENTDFSRMYANQITYLKTKLTQPAFDCPCVDCGGAQKLPEVLVRIKVLYHAEQQDPPQRGRAAAAARRKAITGYEQETLVFGEDLVPYVEESEERRKHTEGQHSRLSVHSGVVSHVFAQYHRILALEDALTEKDAIIASLQVQPQEVTAKRGMRRRRVVDSSSSSDDDRPLGKKVKLAAKPVAKPATKPAAKQNVRKPQAVKTGSKKVDMKSDSSDDDSGDAWVPDEDSNKVNNTKDKSFKDTATKDKSINGRGIIRKSIKNESIKDRNTKGRSTEDKSTKCRNKKDKSIKNESIEDTSSALDCNHTIEYDFAGVSAEDQRAILEAIGQDPGPRTRAMRKR